MNSDTKKIVIFGRGQVGTFYRDYFSAKGFEVVQPEADIRSYEAVEQAIKETNPKFVIDSAGKTNIDWCEQNKLECFEVNVLGADNIAQACQKLGVYLIHLSSGCIFESKSAERSFSEEDLPNPLCFYAWTKVWGDNLLMDRATRHGLKVLILRPRQLLSSMVSPRNALTKMLTYTKFIDTDNSCTVVEDLMFATDELIKQQATGIYNVSNPGITSPYKIAQKLKEIIKPEMQLEVISKEDLNKMTLAIRIDTVLKTDKLEKAGVHLRDLNERLPEIINDLKENLAKGGSEAAMAETEKETAAKLSYAGKQ